MTLIDVNDFTREEECIYDEERYSVRDNGAVFRHPRLGKRVRRDDNQWTFGRVISSNGYLHLSDVRIHRVVATAFHGEPPNPLYVVDHIDTNRKNNRPENLRWVTRLENALMNPITRKKIEMICGSIEAFLENPSMLNAYQDDRNLAWMRTVTPEEAKNCKERMLLWASSDKKHKGGSLGEWVYAPIKKREVFVQEAPASIPEPSIVFNLKVGQEVFHEQFGNGVLLQQEGEGGIARFKVKFVDSVKWILACYLNSKIADKNNSNIEVISQSDNILSDMQARKNAAKEFLRSNFSLKMGKSVMLSPDFKSNTQRETLNKDYGLVMALTKRCAQYNWRTLSCFPCCPEEIGDNPLEVYFQNLKIGAVFSFNDNYPKSMICEFVKTKNNLSILVMCEKDGLKPWSVAEITYENDLFVHANLGSFFDKAGAEKAFCIKQGLEWIGGDTFDDFC